MESELDKYLSCAMALTEKAAQVSYKCYNSRHIWLPPKIFQFFYQTIEDFRLIQSLEIDIFFLSFSHIVETSILINFWDPFYFTVLKDVRWNSEETTPLIT